MFSFEKICFKKESGVSLAALLEGLRDRSAILIRESLNFSDFDASFNEEGFWICVKFYFKSIYK